MRVLLVLSLLLLGSATARADDSRAFFTGNSLYEACTSTEPYQVGLCRGYAGAVVDALSSVGTQLHVCVTDVPNEVNLTQATDVMTKYLRDTPADRNFTAFSNATAAFKQAWPCPK
jgi:hypothetical protein